MATNFWLFWQATDNSNEEWHVAPAEQLESITESAMRVSVLSVSSVQGATAGDDDVLYKGPLFLDLDSKNGLEDAIAQFHRLLKTLDDLQVPLDACSIYASGSKGMHIRIPAAVFNGGKAEKHLYLTYRCLAADLAERASAPGIDLSLYQGKRGHLLRTANKQRLDGRFKVPLTVHEAASLTPELYREYTSAPRPKVSVNMKPATSFRLADLFKKAREAGKELLERKRRAAGVPDFALNSFTDGKHPRCIAWMAEQINVKDFEGVFNQLGMNLAGYLGAAANVSEAGAAALIAQLAEQRARVAGGRSARKRQDYLWSKVALNGDGLIAFTCASARAVLTESPCQGCPVRQVRGKTPLEATGVEEREDGYYRTAGETPVKLTNFIIKPQRLYQPAMDQNGNPPGPKEWSSMDCDLMMDGVKCSDVTLYADTSFASDREFKALLRPKIMGGQLNLDTRDVDRICTYLTAAYVEEVQIMRQVDAVGLNLYVGENQFGKVHEWCYVEPGWCYSKVPAELFSWSGDSPPPVARMQHVKPADPSDPKDVDALVSLLASNEPHVVGRILGWVGACHLKPLLGWHHGQMQFPLLSLHGNSSAGKSASAKVYTALACADYLHRSTASVGAGSAFPIKEMVSASTTVPQVADEMNVAFSTGLNNKIGILKACYCSEVVPQGALGGRKGARVISMKATAPMIYCATAPTSSTELKNRSVEVLMPSFHSPEHEAAFKAASNPEAWERLWKYARLFMEKAVRMSNDDIAQLSADADALVPAEIRDTRQRVNFKTVLCGLKFIYKVLYENDFPDSLIGKLRRLEEVVAKFLREHKEEFVARQAQAETVNVINNFARMAEMNSMGWGLLRDKHFLVVGNTLYLNISCIWVAWKIFKKAVGETGEYSTHDQFCEMLSPEPFYIGLGGVPGHPDYRNWLALDVQGLEARGVDCGAFRG